MATPTSPGDYARIFEQKHRATSSLLEIRHAVEIIEGMLEDNSGSYEYAMRFVERYRNEERQRYGGYSQAPYQREVYDRMVQSYATGKAQRKQTGKGKG